MITGWIAPNGEFFKCAQYEHMASLAKREEFRLVSGVPEILADLAAVEEDCQAAADDGEHPEWHRYEIAQSNASYDIYRKVLDAGFIRVGESRDSLHFEGRPNQLKNKHQVCKDFAESYGADCVFEPQRN